MSKRKSKKNNYYKLITIVLILLSFLYDSFFEQINSTFGMMYDEVSDSIKNNTNDTIKNNDSSNVIKVEKNLKVYYIDVGQADSILIDDNGEYMLIDGGNNIDGPLLVSFFKSLGITNFKYIVGTHPHEDHIGGLDDVIDNFNVDTIYIPDAITTTATFEDLLDAIDKKNITYTVPEIDSTFSLGQSLFKVIYTGNDTSDLNNTSIVLKMTFGNNSFLFTGDATGVTEKKILNKDIEADVLKVGHHGSKYSSTDVFLKKVNPEYTIISVGKNNKYGHPASSTISKLNNLNIKSYRTDNDGTILVSSDGNDISVSKLKTDTNGG